MQRKFETKQADIRKKLMESGITKNQQFEQIISNLINQRERLEVDLKILREKVVALQAKQAKKLTQKKGKQNLSVPKNQINYRQQLNKKYEQLKYWQRKSVKAMNNSTIQMQYRGYLDKLFSVEQQIQLTLKQINDERTTYDKLKKALKLIRKDDKINNNMHLGIERENTLLKKRVFSLKKIVDRQIGKQLQLHNYLIDIKQKQRQIRQKERERYMKMKQSRQIEQQRKFLVKSKQRNRRQLTQYVKRTEKSETSEQSNFIVDIDLRYDNIASKQEIYQIQGRLNRIIKKYIKKITQTQKRIKSSYPNEALLQKRQGSKLAYGRQFQITLAKAKNNLDVLCDLHKRQIQMLFIILKEKNDAFGSIHSRKSSQESLVLGIKTHNYNYRPNNTVNTKTESQDFYNSQKKIFSMNQIKDINNVCEPLMNKVLYPRSFTQYAIQTQPTSYQDPQPLRKEYVGTISQDLTIFDRNILQEQKFSSIQALHIYYTDRGISTVKAIYNIHNNKNHTLQSEIILPESFIQNYCKVHVISAANDDFIRYFKIKLNKVENRIISIKIVTNRNIKSGWGDYKFKEDYDKDQKQDEQIIKELILDIDKDQYPVSIFCSHIQKGPYWYLSGFGVQINEL